MRAEPSGLTAIREAKSADAADVSVVIVRALRETNAADYAPALIEQAAGNFRADRVAELFAKRRGFVAERDGTIVGTASLDGAAVRTVFVRPDRQGLGIGALLMQRVEYEARAQGLKRLTVPSSISAEGFYLRLGYAATRDAWHGEERTIIMEKSL